MDGKKVAALPALEDTLLPAAKGDVLELDEMWSFVGSKANPLWLWLTLCRRTRQVVAFTLGDRSEQSCRWLRESIPDDYVRRATRSDFWETYRAVFPRRTHRLCPKQAGQTCHVERFNLSLRHRLARLTRKTLAFSKRIEAHTDALLLTLTSYNLHRAQQHKV